MEGMYIDESPQGYSFRNIGNLLLLGGGGHRTGKSGDGWRDLEAFARKEFPGAVVLGPLGRARLHESGWCALYRALFQAYAGFLCSHRL